MATYELWLSRPDGRRLTLIPAFLSLHYRRRANDVGELGLVVAADVLRGGPYGRPRLPIAIDSRLEVWRNGVLDTDTVWLIQYVAEWLNDVDERLVVIGAMCADHLLTRRFVNYAAGSAEAQKAAVAADDV